MLKRIIITGLRGGVGATTVATNLMKSISLTGEQAHVIDARAENLMRLHFALDLSNEDGWTKRFINNESWKMAAYSSDDELSFIPYGKLSINEVSIFQSKLKGLTSGLLDVFTTKFKSTSTSTMQWQLILLPNISALDETYRALLESADLIICVVKADIQNYIYFQQDPFFTYFKQTYQPYFLINAYQPLSKNSVDLALVFKEELKKYFLPVLLQQDTAIPDACSQLSNVIKYAPHSQIAEDFTKLSFWLIAHFSAKTIKN